MGVERIEVFKKMLDADPLNTSVLFGLAKEYEKSGQYPELVTTLNNYLNAADDEGNAYGMLAMACEKLGRREEARAAYEAGIKAATAHGHPSMAEEYRVSLTNYED